MTTRFIEQDLSRQDPANATSELGRYAMRLARLPRDESMTPDVLWLLDMLVQRGFRSIAYVSCVLPAADGSGHGYFRLWGAHRPAS